MGDVDLLEHLILLLIIIVVVLDHSLELFFLLALLDLLHNDELED